MNAIRLVEAVTALLLGLAFGSFINVLAFRLPKGRSIVTPPSACPSCETPIKPRDNIPVLSWFLLRGRCRACGEPISARYPIVEAVTGLGFLVAYLDAGESMRTVSTAMLISLAITAALTDMDSWKIPNGLLLPFAVIGLILRVAAPAAGSTERLLSLAAYLGWSLGAAFILVILAAIVARLAGADRGIGMGDVKYVAVLGLFLGPLLPVAVLAAAAAGSMFALTVPAGEAGKGRMVRFGPFLSFGAVFAAFYGERFLTWYLATAGLA